MQGKYIRFSLVLAILITLLAGCSSVKLGYRFVDNAIRWKINDYVSLNRQQSAVVTRKIKEFHRWHQTTQVADYAKFMERKALQFEQANLSAADFSKIYDEAFSIMSVSLDELVPVITDMLLSLKTEQIPQVIKNLERESAKDLKKDFGITPAQRLNKRKNKMIQRVVKWTGNLNKPQLEMIAAWAKELPVDKEVRVSRQSGFLEMVKKQLKDRSNPEQFKRTILAHVKTPERFSSPAYKQSYAKRKQRTLQLMSDLYNSLNPNQKSRLIASTKKYQMDFLALVPRQ